MSSRRPRFKAWARPGDSTSFWRTAPAKNSVSQRESEQVPDAARKRPELANLTITFLPVVPQAFVDVDRDKAMKQGVDLTEVYQTLQAFMGGAFVNYFNRFGRTMASLYRGGRPIPNAPGNFGHFYVRNATGQPVPLASLSNIKMQSGPEFTLRYNLFRSAQINGSAAPGYSSARRFRRSRRSFAKTMPPEMGYDYLGMSFQEKQAQKGVSADGGFRYLAVVRISHSGGALRKLVLPFSVLFGTPVAVLGAFLAL